MESSKDLVDKGLGFSRLLSDEVTTTLLSDFDERIAGHVLHSLVRLVHELEELVDDCLEELPVSLEESGVLSDNVHDAEEGQTKIGESARKKKKRWARARRVELTRKRRRPCCPCLA